MKHFLYLSFVMIFCTEKGLSNISTNFAVKFEALKPSGLRITIPDNKFKSVSFFGKLNHSLYRKEWRIYSPRAKQNMWVLQDRNIQLNLGDSIEYNIGVVDKTGLGFPIYGNWIVTNFTEDEELDCVISKTEVQCGRKVCSGSLIFSEDFNDPFITNLTQWQFEKYYPQEPDYPFNVYLSEAVTTLDGGKVEIKPMPVDSLLMNIFIDDPSFLNNIRSCTGEIATNECYRPSSTYFIQPPVISGKITTRKSFNFKYGKVEIKAKLPEGDWIIPELLLEPFDHEYGKLRYGSGIMRIAFSRGNRENSYELYGGPIVHDKEPLRSKFLKFTENEDEYSWTREFHTYAVVWTPDSIEMLVDGVSYGIVNSSIWDLENLKPFDTPHIKMHQIAWKQGGLMAPFDKMFYISLGVRVGGIHDFPDAEDKLWKNKSPKAMYEFANNKKSWYRSWSSPELIVDSVKVYAL